MSAKEKKEGIKINPLSIIFVIAYLVVAVVFKLLLPDSSDDMLISRVAGQIIGTMFVAIVITWLAWLISKRSNSAATITLCVVMTLGITRSISSYLLPHQINNNQDFVKLEQDLVEIQKKQLSTLEKGIETGDAHIDETAQLLNEAADRIEQTAQNSSGANADLAQLEADFLRELQPLVDEYGQATKKLQNAGAFDISSLRAEDDIAIRKQATQNFLVANNKFKQFFIDAEEYLTKRLQNMGADKRHINMYINKARTTGQWEINIGIRDCDSRMASAFLEILDLFDANWPLLEYDHMQQNLVINDKAVFDKYQELAITIQSAATEQQKLQIQLIDIRKKELQ